MARKKSEVIISFEELLPYSDAWHYEGHSFITLAQQVYNAYEDLREKYGYRKAFYFEQLAYHFPKYHKQYYRRMYYVYGFFVVKHQIPINDISPVHFRYLHKIATTKKGLFNIHLIKEALKYLAKPGTTAAQKEAYICEVQDKRRSLLKVMKRVRKRYDAEAVEKSSLMHKA